METVGISTEEYTALIRTIAKMEALCRYLDIAEYIDEKILRAILKHPRIENKEREDK